jgi:hypothetical protein
MKLEALGGKLFGIPYTGMIACRTSVQMVRAIVHGQLIFYTVQFELTLGDTVSVTTDEGAKEWFWTVDCLVNSVMALDDIGIVAIFVRYHDSYYGTTIISNGYFGTRFVLQDEEVGLLAVYNFLKIGSLEAAQIFSWI